MEWETAQHGGSHIDLIVDDGENCSAEELLAGVVFPPVAGQAIGEPDGCMVNLTSVLEMRGDPSTRVTLPFRSPKTISSLSISMRKTIAGVC